MMRRILLALATGVFALATLGALGALIAAPGLRPALLALWLAAIPMTLILFAAVAVTVALTLHDQGETLWGVPEETRANYQEIRQTLDRFFGVAPLRSP